MTVFFEKSYKNTRTKKEVVLTDGLFFGMWVGLERAALPLARQQSVHRTLCCPWESPSKSRCIRYGCRLNLNMSENEIKLV